MRKILGKVCGCGCCGKDEKTREQKMRILFDIYDADGGFNLDKNELRQLGDFLHQKKVSSLNAEVEALVGKRDAMASMESEHFMAILLENKRGINYKSFEKIMKDVNDNELGELLQGAKLDQFTQLREELDL